MEINWKMLKWGLVFGSLMGLLQIINVLTAYQTPPDWWTVVRFAILPAIGIVVTTILQRCFPGEKKPEVKP